MPELPWMTAEHLPELIPGLIFLYTHAVLLFTTLLLIGGLMRARFRLAEVVTRDQLLAVFAQTGFRRLGPRIVDPAPSDALMRDTVGVQSRFRFRRARREIAQHYRDRLVRVQFFTGVAGLLAIAALGWMQDLHITNFEIAIPAGPSFVAALVLVLLFVTCRLTVDIAAKSLLARMSELPFRSTSGRTLLITAEADRVGSASVTSSSESPVGVVSILAAIEGLMEVVEGDRSSLREPMLQLAESAEALAAMAKVISERPADAAPANADATTGKQLKTAIDQLATRIEQLAERPADAAPAAAYAATGEVFKTAIDQLAERIEQLAERPAGAAPAAAFAAGEQLKTAIDQLSTRIEQLAERPADAAPAAAFAAGEELKTAIDRLATRIEQLAERPADAAPAAAFAAGEELKTAIDQLATRIEQLAERPADAAPAAAYAATGEVLKTAIDRLAARIEQLAERPADAAPAVAYAAGEELKTAIDQLATRIEQLAERPADAAPASAYATTGEAFKTAIDQLAARIEQLAERPADAAPAAAFAAGEELKTAIDRLATRIEQLAERPATLRGDLQELRDLLKEFE